MSVHAETIGPDEPDAYPPPTAEPEPDAVDEVEELAQAYDFEENSRKWLRAITGLIEHRNQEHDPSDRVQFALDMLVIAAAERAVRILRSDLPSSSGQ